MAQDNQLMDAQGLADLLRISKRSVFRLLSNGRIIAPLKIGGSLRWSEKSISEWLAAGAPDRKTWEAAIKKAGGQQ